MISRFTRTLIKPTSARYFSEITHVEGNRPPLQEENVPGRYAGVLFTIASQRELLHTVNEDMEYLNQLINQSENFNSFLRNTAAKKDEHDAVFAEINGGLDELTVTFLGKKINFKASG